MKVVVISGVSGIVQSSPIDQALHDPLRGHQRNSGILAATKDNLRTGEISDNHIDWGI